MAKYAVAGRLALALLVAVLVLLIWHTWSPWQPWQHWKQDISSGSVEFSNPIIHADYSDPDVLRVGDDYYMTASSFVHEPGLPILHSRDLVNWTLINYAVRRLPGTVPGAKPAHGGGIWAPSMAHHNGLFYIYYGDPDKGIFVVTSRDPAQPWSEPHLALPGRGLIDPTPLWLVDDSDNALGEGSKAYLLHGWARSRAGFNNILSLREMSLDGLTVSEQRDDVVDGANMPGWTTIEGPKFYRRNDEYIIFSPAGGVATGWQGVYRADSITGPYQYKNVLEQGTTDINGPHQGPWVQTATGEDWFIHFQDKEAFGRIVHMQPMQWVDGWPQVGRQIAPDQPGQPLSKVRKTGLTEQRDFAADVSDDFSKAPNLHWQWQSTPSANALVNDQDVAGLTLTSLPVAGGNLWNTSNLLAQKFPANHFQVDTLLRGDNLLNNGDSAGLVVMGEDYAWIGLQRIADRLALVWVKHLNAAESDDRETTIISDWPQRTELLLRAQVQPDASVQFSYAAAGGDFVAVDMPFNARTGRWVGAKMGLFSGNLSFPQDGAISQATEQKTTATEQKAIATGKRAASASFAFWKISGTY